MVFGILQHIYNGIFAGAIYHCHLLFENYICRYANYLSLCIIFVDTEYFWLSEVVIIILARYIPFATL